MILGQISYPDCIVFLIFLVPQLLLNVNPVDLFVCISKALPFFVIELPYQIISERYFTSLNDRAPFVKQASFFQDVVIRCVRYAFAKFPASIGRVFFSKPVALPFLRFRMLRHGYRESPIPWREIKNDDMQGLYMCPDPESKPDILIYYCHGGGFSMGSAYFYLEFLLAWTSLLKDSGYKNPAIFSLEYSLVPDAAYPTQLNQVKAGYDFVCTVVEDPSRICVGGDSAGATLILALLLSIGKGSQPKQRVIPGFATLISPWTNLLSARNRNTPSDYLNDESLHLYGRQYAGSDELLHDPLVSPGECTDGSWWAKSCPSSGIGVMFGAEEVLGPELRRLISLLRKNGCGVIVREDPGGIHAWPVVTLFLSDTREERIRGLQGLVKMIKQGIPPGAPASEKPSQK